MSRSAQKDFVIESPRPGWRLGTVVGIAFVIVWCIVWYRDQAGPGGDNGSLITLLVGLVAGLGTLAALFDRVYTRWRVRFGQDMVSVTRWGLLTSQGWTCAPSMFRLGQIETVEDSEGTPLFGSDRFIAFHMADEDVRFMVGHKEEILEATRSKIEAGIQVGLHPTV